MGGKQPGDGGNSAAEGLWLTRLHHVYLLVPQELVLPELFPANFAPRSPAITQPKTCLRQ